jgi:hypothetical protein
MRARKFGIGQAGGFALCLIAFAASWLVPATGAEASEGPARYLFEICDPSLPSGNTPGVFFEGDTRYAIPNNTCSQQASGSLGISAPGGLSKDTGSSNSWTVPISAPAGGAVESLTISAATCGASGSINRNYVFQLGWPGNCVGEVQRTFALPPGTSRADVPVALECPSLCQSSVSIYARYIVAKEVDPVAPQVQDIHGPLLGGGVARGHQVLEANASDQGGGVSSLKVLVNGQSAGAPISPTCGTGQVTNPSIVGIVATSPAPCPTTFTGKWTLDTASPPFRQGVNTIQVCASDFATLSAPNTGCSTQQPVYVDNSCSESPVAGGDNLTASFAGSNNEKITVPFRHSAKIRGALTDASGDAISGATVCVQAQTLGVKSPLVPVTTATTDAHGHFTYKVPAGPGRRIGLGYRRDSFQIDQQLRFQSRARPTIRLSTDQIATGGRIKISGRVPGPNAGGCGLIFEAAALHSNEWFEFEKATTNRRGVYHLSYVFDATTKTTVYKIRAVTQQQGGYPWQSGHSVPAIVRVYTGG